MMNRDTIMQEVLEKSSELSKLAWAERVSQNEFCGMPLPTDPKVLSLVQWVFMSAYGMAVIDMTLDMASSGSFQGAKGKVGGRVGPTLVKPNDPRAS